MEDRVNRAAMRFQMWQWCCVAIFVGASRLAVAQPLACSAGAAGASGLYGSGSGLLSALSLGSGGAAVAGASGLAAAVGGSPLAQPSCAPAEPASIAGQGPSPLAGNPVDVVTGVKVDRAIDAYLSSSSRGSLDDAAELVLSRFYASDSIGSRALGPGWRLGLDVRLYASNSGGRRMLQIVQGDGRHISFGPQYSSRDGGLLHDALAHEDGVLERTRGDPDAAGSRWIWHWRNGRALAFDIDGRLRRIDSPAGSPLALDYDALGRLSAVRSAAGRAVFLRYRATTGTDDAKDASTPGRLVAPQFDRLAALAGAAGDIVHYHYDQGGRLAQVSFADGARVGYEYTDANSPRLSAVVLPDGKRSDYRYRPDGRVAYSRAAGDGEALALHFDYRSEAPVGPAAASSGVTTVRAGGTVRATYRWRRPLDGAPARVLAAVGPGCGRCPPTGRHYQYDRAGRVVAIRSTTANGSGLVQPTLAIVRDAAGRPREFRWGAGADRRVRVAWRDDALHDVLFRIDRPSVVPGLRASLQPVRDPRGRVVAVEQTGYAPAFDGTGRAEPGAALPLRRVSTSVFPLADVLVPPMLATQMPGGAHTRVWRDDFGRAVALRSPDFGLVRRRFDDGDRLVSEQRADGSVAQYRYDGDGRLVEYRETQAAGSASGSDNDNDNDNAPADDTTRLRWSQGRLAEVGNDNQHEWLTHDADARLVGRRVALRLESGRIVDFEMRVEYDENGRASAWSLPGGGWIRAHADASGQTVALEWQPTDDAFARPVVSALERDRFGLRRAVYGNGVAWTVGRTAQGRLAEISHRGPRDLRETRWILHHRFVFDRNERLLQWRRGAQAGTHLYDAGGRLLQVSRRGQTGERLWRFAYDAQGNRLLAQRDAPVPVQWDAAGRLVADAARSYRWDAAGHLREVREAGRTIARYRYDARGLRVAKVVDGVATHYLYDAQRRLLAELDDQGGVSRQYVHLADRPVAVLDRAGPSPGRTGITRGPRRIRYLHLNHLGAPEAVTDERARRIWRAEYAPFGRRLHEDRPGTPGPHAGSGPAPRAEPAFALALRLPGQYEDRETGLHYNDHRYYDPDTGRYLSPDPLGIAGGPNLYVYAGNDPLTRVDPSGLLLFAFDGTGNGDPPSRSDDWSNVYKLSRAYSDGRVWYMAGVGRDDPASGIPTNATDPIVANTARARVDSLLAELEAAASAPSARGAPMDVDVIGFSRGAAMARDFSNRVADRISDGSFRRLGACVRLRFLGLWDTVAQFGADGLANIAWRLSVPVETAYAAQAVALNEHRTLFPAESIVGSALAGVRIERGFVGAHADVGGSYAEGDLSDVALIWMHEQAQLAGVRMFALTSEFARVTAPLLHDSNTDGIGDREFRYRNSWGWTFANPMQRVARVDGLQWRDTLDFIQRFPAPQLDAYGEPTIAGSVDMRGYAEWLKANYAIEVAR